MSQKLFERVIASGNHLLTQVKNNQPGLRRKLALGSAGRKPRDCARSETKGRNRFETRELKAFDAKAWFSRTPWEKLIKTVLRLERTILRRNPATGLWTRSCETVFWVSSASGFSPEQWNAWIRGHWRIENGSHYVRDATFAEDASRIRKNPDIAARLRSFAYNLLRTGPNENIKNARWRAGRHQSVRRNNDAVLRTKQPWSSTIRAQVSFSPEHRRCPEVLERGLEAPEGFLASPVAPSCQCVRRLC